MRADCSGTSFLQTSVTHRHLPSGAKRSILQRVIQGGLFVLVVVLQTSGTYATQIDTVMNIGISSIFGTIIISHDGKKFMTVDFGVRHAVRTFADPFHPVADIVMELDFGEEAIPVGFLSNGDVILRKNSRVDSLVRWSQSSNSVSGVAGGLFSPEMRQGSDVIIMRIPTDSGSMNVHVELDPFRYTVMFPNAGKAEILGTGSHVVLLSDSSILVYDTYLHKRVQKILLPEDMYGYETSFTEVGISYQDVTSPVLMVVSPNHDFIRRFNINNNKELAPIAIPQQSCWPLMLWYNNSGDTIVTLCARTEFQSMVALGVSRIVDNRMESLWSAEIEESEAGRNLTDSQWLGDGRFVVTTQAGSTLFSLDSSRGNVIALRYPALNVVLESNGSGVALSSVYAGQTTYFDFATGSLDLIRNIDISSVHAGGTDVVADLWVNKDSTTRIVLQNIKTGSIIRSVNVVLPTLNSYYTPLSAISSDLHYAALVLNNDTIVVQDLNDTTRVLVEECANCGKIAVDFASNNEELVVVGEKQGGVWDLRSMRNVFYDSALIVNYFDTFDYPNFGFNASGNVLLPNPEGGIAIFDRKARAIRITRNNLRGTTRIIDDNTILVVNGDSLFILDSLLSTVHSIPIFLFRNTEYSWNAKFGRIALQKETLELLILDYNDDTMTSVEDSDATASNSTRQAFYNTFTISVPNEDAKAVHVFDVTGNDVTGWALVTTLGDRTIVESLHLLSGVYFIVDGSSGWRAAVALFK